MTPVPPHWQKLLQHRAEKLRQAAAVTKEEAAFWVSEFSLGDEQYAIPLESLRAALPLKSVTPVPLSSAEVIGVCRFQGEIIPALSLAVLLTGRAYRRDSTVLVVVDPGWGRLFALDCEQIPRPITIPQSVIKQAKRRDGGAVLQAVTQDLRQLNLIDLPKLLERQKEKPGAH